MTQAADAPGSVDGRDRRWDDHRQERRERLLAAAVALIDRDGGDVGVVAIAAEAGIPRSVVYKLFRDREDLDEQIRIRIIEEATAALMPFLTPRGTVREAVHAATKTYVDWVTGHANLHRFIGTGSTTRPTPGSPSIAGGKAAFAQRVADLTVLVMRHKYPDTKIPKGMAENLAFALTGITDSVVNRWLVAGRARSSKRDVTRFVAESCLAVIESAGRSIGVPVDLDAPVLA